MERQSYKLAMAAQRGQAVTEGNLEVAANQPVGQGRLPGGGDELARP